MVPVPLTGEVTERRTGGVSYCEREGRKGGAAKKQRSGPSGSSARVQRSGDRGLGTAAATTEKDGLPRGVGLGLGDEDREAPGHSCWEPPRPPGGGWPADALKGLEASVWGKEAPLGAQGLPTGDALCPRPGTPPAELGSPG